jgi:hypothetical protein
VARAAPGAPTAAVGQPLQVRLRAAAPAGLPLTIRHALAAGVQVDTPSLEALVRAGKLVRFESADGVLELSAPALSPGQVLDASYRVIPTLAGTLHAPASTLSVGTGAGKTTYLPSPPLVVR